MIRSLRWLGLVVLASNTEAFSPLPVSTTAASPISRRDRVTFQTPLQSSRSSLGRRDRVVRFQSSVGLGSKTPEDAGVIEEAAAADVALSDELIAQQRKDVIKKIMNGLLLAASFGFAAYTILNIDHGMTRGWTQSEIAMRIPLDNWLNYESSLADRPIFTKTAINVIIYLLGDWLSQTLFSGNHPLDFDAARTLRNGFIGLCFGPLVHEYYQFSDRILPVEGGMWNRLEKILMDQTVYLTVKCSIYISAVGLLQGDDINTVKTNVQTKLPSIVLTAWKFWPLVHLVTYGVIPARHRILWVNCVDLVWNAILATMSQKTEVAEEETLVLESATLLDQSSLLLEPSSHVDASVVADPFLHQNSVSVPLAITAESLLEDQAQGPDSSPTTLVCERSAEDEVLVVSSFGQKYVGNSTTVDVS